MSRHFFFKEKKNTKQQKKEESKTRKKTNIWTAPAPEGPKQSYSSPEIIIKKHFRQNSLNGLSMLTSQPWPFLFYVSLSEQNKLINGFSYINIKVKSRTWTTTGAKYLGCLGVSLSGSLSLKQETGSFPFQFNDLPVSYSPRKKCVHTPPNLQQKISILSPT